MSVSPSVCPSVCLYVTPGISGVHGADTHLQYPRTLVHLQYRHIIFKENLVSLMSRCWNPTELGKCGRDFFQLSSSFSRTEFLIRSIIRVNKINENIFLFHEKNCRSSKSTLCPIQNINNYLRSFLTVQEEMSTFPDLIHLFLLIFYALFFCFFTATYTAEKSSSPLSSKTDLYCSFEAVVVGRSIPNDALSSKANLNIIIFSNLWQIFFRIRLFQYFDIF